MKIRREAKVGLFALLMLVALYWGINFLRGRDLFSRTNTYFATYDQVSGIQKSSGIMIRGFKVGVVGDISYNPARSDKIVLQFNIRSKYKIPDNSHARIFSDGLLGGRAIEIVMGNSPNFLRNRDTLHTVSDKDFLEVAGSELEFLKQKASVLVDNVNKTLENINRAFTENSANLNAAMNNLAQMSGTLNYVLTTEKEHLRSIIDNINSLSQTLRSNASKVDNIMTNFETFSGSLAQTDVKGMVDGLSASVGRFDDIMAKIDCGEGSLGLLLNDPELYDMLTTASTNLAALLEDLRQNPGRYVNISVFGRRER